MLLFFLMVFVSVFMATVTIWNTNMAHLSGKRLSLPAFVLLTLGLSCSAHARDTELHLSLTDALDSPAFAGKLNPGIQFYFGDQSHPAPTRTLIEVVSNRKTNAVGKSDVEACEWVLLSAMLSLQERAIAEGGNAVVNIRSYFKKDTFSSTTEFECHAGAIMAGVALIGEIVVLP